MPHFAYEGRNARGELVKGVLEGPSSGSIADQLFNTGITPIRIDETASAAAAAPGRGWQLQLGAQRVGLDDLMLFCRQLHTLLKSGVPIIRALAGLREASSNPALAAVLLDLRDNLEAGREMSVAMQRHPRVFSPFMVAMVRVGEMTGRLDEVFLRLYEFYAFEKNIREKVAAALRYPGFVIAAIVAAMFVINIFVIPAFAKLFSAFKAQLPLATRILIGTSDFFVGYWWLVVAGAVGLALLFRVYTKTAGGRYQWDRLKLRVPVVGELIHKATLARFTRSFALATRSGVPIVQALSVVANVVDNAFMEDRIAQMRNGIERGESILRTAATAGIFNSLVLQMIAVGEETGEIDAMMDDVATLYEREVTLEVEGLAAKLEPILLLVMGGLVLILALGIFLPMWELASVARGGR
ncbi:MAG TPA: type II secretion system F family protein [Burkholderiales bacterium]|nr:type II secretion system F family protein [Burkholderiales bacterium]